MGNRTEPVPSHWIFLDDGTVKETGTPPQVAIAEALRSPAKRRERDEQLAAWCGLVGDEVEAFCARVALYDVREAARQQEEAVARLDAARRRRVEAEWRGDLERPRGKGIMRRLPKPRAA